MSLRLPRFDRSVPIVEQNRIPTLPFHQWWDLAAKAIERSVTGIQEALDAAGIALDAADTAQEAATAAQLAADSVGTVSKLSNSGVSGLTLTATDAGTDVTISISAHTRVYSDGTSVPVNAGNFTGKAYSTVYYIYYDDPTFAGGAVTYQITTVQADAAQTGNRHLVGQVTTPAAGQPPEEGYKPAVPGFGGLER